MGSGGDFRLGDWLVHPAQCRLSKDGRTVQVRAKVMDLLASRTATGGRRPMASPCRVGVVGADQASLVYTVGGHMGMSRLELVRLGPDRATALGPPELLPFGEQASGVTIAPSGRAVYVRQQRDTGFWSLDLERPGQGVVESRVSSSFHEFSPHVSPDGRRLAFASTRSGTQEIWTADMDGAGSRPAR